MTAFSIRCSRTAAVLAAAVLALSSPADATSGQRLDFPLRGRTLTVSVYRAAQAPPLGTIVMGSGDVGWVGLGVDMAEYLSDRGYTLIGINSRQYLGAFTSGKVTLKTSDIPGDFLLLFQFLEARQLITPPVFLSGVSEGAALSALAASSERNHAWVNGVFTMGLPGTAELGWKWSDFTTWITKKDSGEPMFVPTEFVPSIAPIPLCMIQSKKDEYVTPEEFRALEQAAREPKRQVLIDASNHRFTDKRKELEQEVLGCLAWMKEHQVARQ
jgi:alpha-beta hydrolase superfamily lysophospholipase